MADYTAAADQLKRIAEIHGQLQRALEPDERKRPEVGSDFLNHVPKIKCADGLTFSMQASAYHYCQPRNSIGPWFSVEIGFPNREVPEWREWMEGDGDPTDTVYGYVPLQIVAAVVASAGGLAA